MTVALCVDTRYGMLFHNRRQSRDQAVLDRLLVHAAGKKLWMNAYSAKLFPRLPENACVSEDFFRLAGQEDICFAENISPISLLDQCDRLILFCWNRHYPADTCFPEEALSAWTRKHTYDFAGNSHEMITEMIYEK